MLAVAFLWHHHQPYYPDNVSGQNLMPWVRLHGVKDYYGMARHLQEAPEMACTINLVPSLLLQMQNYVDRGATDQFMDISRISADSLTEEDCLFLLNHFFMADPECMIRPFPRFFELYQRRGLGKNSARKALPRFNKKDFLDLQVMFNLAWVHPLAFEADPDLNELRNRSSNFSEGDKNWLLDKHLDILEQIIPLHQQLHQRGQVELTTTPFYHPIFPLLLDKKLAREGTPDISLPKYPDGYPEDAALQLRRAVDFHRQIFGESPKGMWPAEGSVCQSMIPYLAQEGIRWMATDEGILHRSTQGFISRDSEGNVQNPDRMYRPYQVSEGTHQLSIVFRDHVLSDRIGFHYQRSDPAQAADDFLRHLLDIEHQVGGAEPALVTIILDGENCWEHYPNSAVPFLRTLHQRLIQAPKITPVRISDFLEQYPPRDSIPHLFAGSWIRHNFNIWIGKEEENTAWDLLHQTRSHLQKRSQLGHISPDIIQKAWEEIYIAEGSDWFWWYGDDHTSVQDELFDFLFRRHLMNVYNLLGDSPPPELEQPIFNKSYPRPIYSLPRSFLQVKVNGRHTFFEWLGAGKYIAHDERGTMAMVKAGPIKEIHFGFTLETLLVRIDFDVAAQKALTRYDEVRIGFVQPHGYLLVLVRSKEDTPTNFSPPGALDYSDNEPPRMESQLKVNGRKIPESRDIQVGVDRILELSIPFSALEVQQGDPIEFYVEIREGTQSRDRGPRSGTFNLICPSPDFEHIMWQV